MTKIKPVHGTFLQEARRQVICLVNRSASIISAVGSSLTICNIQQGRDVVVYVPEVVLY